MAKVKVIYDRNICIGTNACVVACGKYWKLVEDGKADLIGGTLNKDTGRFELILEGDEEFLCNKEAADVCPVIAIKVEKLE